MGLSVLDVGFVHDATIFYFHDSACMDATLNDQWSLFTWSLRCEVAVDFKSVETVVLWANQWRQISCNIADMELRKYTIGKCSF